MASQSRDNDLGELRLFGVQRLFGFIYLCLVRGTMCGGKKTTNL